MKAKNSRRSEGLGGARRAAKLARGSAQVKQRTENWDIIVKDAEKLQLSPSGASMSKILSFTAALLVASVPSAFALSGTDISGNWVVTWLSNNSKNAMSLAYRNERFSGTYVNDDKSSCSVSGNFSASDGRVSLQIVCPNWDIRMQGAASSDGKTIAGSYQAYIDSAGKFTMSKQ